MNRPNVPPDLRRWVDTWRDAEAALSEVKVAELARLETTAALRQLADAFNSALAARTTTTTSGLIEQQAIFQRLRV